MTKNMWLLQVISVQSIEVILSITNYNSKYIEHVILLFKYRYEKAGVQGAQPPASWRPGAQSWVSEASPARSDGS